MSRWPTDTLDRVLLLLDTRSVEQQELLTVTEAGSTAHAISVGLDDLDFTVVRIEPFDELISGSGRRQSMMIRTKPEGVRSEPGDIDLQVYTFRKFVRLAANANPSVLMILFAAPELRLVDNAFPSERIADLTRSRRAAASYAGYMEQQLERWTGGRGQKNVSRPDLVAEHGFDTKYAAHAVRLGFQGIEYLKSGRITLPMPEPNAEAIRSLRRGEMTEPEALAWASDLKALLDEAAETSPLPAEPDHEAIDGFLADFYADALGVARES